MITGIIGMYLGQNLGKEGWLKTSEGMVGKLGKDFERIKEKEISHKIRVYKPFIHKASGKFLISN